MVARCIRHQTQSMRRLADASHYPGEAHPYLTPWRRLRAAQNANNGVRWMRLPNWKMLLGSRVTMHLPGG
jgi:hypothetical protein